MSPQREKAGYRRASTVPAGTVLANYFALALLSRDLRIKLIIAVVR